MGGFIPMHGGLHSKLVQMRRDILTLPEKKCLACAYTLFHMDENPDPLVQFLNQF